MAATGLVTVFCPFTTAGNGKTALHATGGTRLPDDCNVYAIAFVAHVKTTFVPAIVIVSCGGSGNVRLKIVPLPAAPPSGAVPYNVLPDKIMPPYVSAPSLLVNEFPDCAVKLYKLTNPVPSVLMVNIVPVPLVPPPLVAP